MIPWVLIVMSCDAIASSSDSIPQRDKIAELHKVLDHISPMPKTKEVRKRKSSRTCGSLDQFSL